eukprot:409026-Pelagomonas_calceolata.AAC.5
MANPTLFEDIFEVLVKDPDGKKFDKGGWCSGCASGFMMAAWRLCHTAHLDSCSCMPFLRACPLAVSRYQCRSDLYECDLTLDVNVDVYPLEVNAKYQVALANTLNADGTAGSTNFDAVSQPCTGPVYLSYPVHSLSALSGVE